MTEEIKNNLNNPGQLEKLYRDNKAAFKRAFNLLYPEINESTVAQTWNARLNFEREAVSKTSNREWIIVFGATLIAWLIAKIPHFAELDEETFYSRNIGFIVFPLLAAYFAWKHKIQMKHILIASGAFLASVLYINFLPEDRQSDTLVLACIHLPLFLWAVLGFVFTGQNLRDSQSRLNFLRYNGDLAIMTTLILIAGALLTGITIGLFELTGVSIDAFYFEYIVIWGLAAAPIVGTYLVLTNQQLVSKVAPVLAKVFTPLVLVTLVIYLIALAYNGKDPFHDREFLLIFNLLLIGVMAIILFSIAEISKNATGKSGTILLLALSVVTIIVNGIALSAILFRISEWGITPNRLAVLGGNILILTNLLIVTYRLYKAAKDTSEIEKVENSIASFLPIYTVWTMLVTFLVPVIFGFE